MDNIFKIYMATIKSTTGHIVGKRREVPEHEHRTQEDIDWEKSLLIERITALYDEPLKDIGPEGLLKREQVIDNLFARKRSLEV